MTNTTTADGTDPLADSLATAERARDTDTSPPSTESATTPATSIETPPAESTTADAATDEVSIPPRLPDPETTIYRDSTTVIRLLQTETMTDAVEVRLYRAAGTDSASTTMATDGGRRESLDALPAATRQRFETAVDTVADRFDLAVDDDGRLRARRDDHGRAGVLEFAARLTDR